jgi:hypothetical protein
VSQATKRREGKPAAVTKAVPARVTDAKPEAARNGGELTSSCSGKERNTGMTKPRLYFTGNVILLPHGTEK